MIVACHHHYVPEEVVFGPPAEVKETYWQGVPEVTIKTLAHPSLYQIDEQVRHMQSVGVDFVVLSSVAGLHANMQGCQFINDRTAQIARAYPQHFAGLASVPAADPGAPGELQRAVVELGLRGVFIPCQIDGEPLDSPKLRPFYARAAELGVPVFVHPAIAPPVYDLVNDYDLHRIVGREFDLVVETLRLIFGGVLEAFPGLKIVMPHLGGGVAALVERIGPTHHWSSDKTPGKPFDELLSRLYFDMAGFEGGMKALRCALMTLSPQQLVFGTDYPLDFYDKLPALRAYIDDIKALPLPGPQIDGMLGGNISALCGGL